MSSLSQEGDKVWVRTVEENWLYGKVTGKNIRVGQTRRVSLVKSGLNHGRLLGTPPENDRIFLPRLFWP